MQGRYKSILVDKDSYLHELCRYVVLNPVRAGMVPSVENWHWSSYLPTAGRMPCPPWLNTAVVLGLFGDGAAARRAYERFVEEGLKQPSPWETLKGQIYLGSDAFHAQMKKRLSGKTPKGVSRRQMNPVRPSAQAVLRTVAEAHHINPAAALERRNGPAFKQAVYLLRRRANLSLREVAEMAGVTIGRVAQIQTEVESLPGDESLKQIVTKL